MKKLSGIKVDEARRLLSARRLLCEGQSIRRASEAVQIGVQSARRIQKSIQENIPPPKMGRPRKIPARTRCNLALDFSTGRILTLKEAKREIEMTDGVDVHENTVRRNLRQMGVKAYVKPVKPKLTPNHVEARLRFAKEHANWTVDQWKQVMFSDETTFIRVGSFGRQFHYSDQEHRLHFPHQIKESVQAGGGKIFFWGRNHILWSQLVLSR